MDHQHREVIQQSFNAGWYYYRARPVLESREKVCFSSSAHARSGTPDLIVSFPAE